MKSFFFWSKWLHKYVGLSCLLLLFFTAFTGILINHPSFLANYSVPANWLGQSYQYSNWNRFSFRDSLLLDDGSMYIAGKMGVFYSSGSKAAFQEINSGLPNSFYLRDSNCLLATVYDGKLRLFVGGRSGLYYRDIDSSSWHAITTVGNHEIVDLVMANDTILAFSAHDSFSAPVIQEDPVFERIPLKIDSKGKRVPGYRLLFELHSGRLFGLSGRLLVDFAALTLLFLCVSAFYIWCIPWSKRRLGRNNKRHSWFAPLYSWHLSLGIWIAGILFIIAGSGALIRPPLILLSGAMQIPFSWLLQETPEILKAVIAGDGSLILATRDGWYRGESNLQSPLKAIVPPVPVFGMGATVLEPLAGDKLLVGSFSGLYKWNPGEDFGVDVNGNRAVDTGAVRPGEIMAAGAIIRDGMFVGYADYKKGLLALDNSPILDRKFPSEKIEHRTSLYHFLFELHSGRFLRDSIGSFYILYVPLLGLALMLIAFTGVFDWLKRKIKRLRK